ncbi:50S ribosomal protein L25/general stress protein Ctc [Neobacillus piezotolerans]|uniref:Large ribosomal subunit protein bL25 n=1 Tax=Neobacillus piezotolerans TaxID=2259171 RepID=A0A3D8GK51_9BACI|nr:50S ribosomal protein L25/general stress protein Ctc [Neobacillus piezotolerans]RDU34798.1 50S ribosomal protein L25/general stress protein Ctc [Neobacillus piezotolerans]
MSTVLQAKNRGGEKKVSVRKLRREGNIPAVVYGSKVESVPVYVSAAEFAKTIKQVGRNGIISLDVEGQKQDVVLTEYQKDVINNEITHADFLAVDKSSKINVDVNVALVGDAPGVKDGGILQQPLFTVSITSTPANIPPSIEVDITNLQVGETITIADLNTDGKYLINHEEDEVVASILPPKVEEEIDSGEQQDGGVPENEEGRETEASEE